MPVTGSFRDRVEVVAMDGCGGYTTAATDSVPDAVTVMDLFPSPYGACCGGATFSFVICFGRGRRANSVVPS